MAFSYSVLGVLLMLDITFITNFFVIRALRKWTNNRTDESTTLLDSDDGAGEFVEYKASCVETFLFGWVLGKIKPDALNKQRFPNWRPIPWYIGVTTTCFLVLVGNAFLSPEFLNDKFGISMAGVAVNTQLCEEIAREDALKKLEDDLKKMMNFDVAVAQFEVIWGMTPALQKDVALYGTGKWKCKASEVLKTVSEADTYKLDGKLEQWKKRPIAYPAAKWGTYFPGYCRALHDSKRKLDSLKICGPKEICKCPRLPNKFPFSTIGQGGAEFCAMEICFTFDNIPCGEMVDYGGLVDMFPPNNYRSQQLKYAEEQQKLEMESQEFPSTANDMGDGAAQKFNEIYRQINLASGIYSIYACFALYFPSPIDVFRKPYITAVKGFLFGAKKSGFMVGVIAFIWLKQHITQLMSHPDIADFIANLKTGDPCFLDGEYMLQRQKILSELCDVLLPLEPNFTMTVGTANSIIHEVAYFASSATASPKGCACDYPMVELKAFASTAGESYSQNNMAMLGFTRQVKSMDNVFLPVDGMVFSGNLTVCQDAELAREIVLRLEDTSKSSGGGDIKGMWLETGLLATLVLKFVMANFVISLLKIADPFVVCRGEFMWIPAKYGLGLDGVDKATMFAEFKKTKEASLYYINFRGFIVWGIIMHLALFNLMTAGSGGSIGGDDALVFQFCMAVAAVVVGAGLILICCLNSNGKRANKKRQNGKDPDGEESDEDAEESDEDAESSDEDDFSDEE